MLGGADNPNGELPSYITGADTGSALPGHAGMALWVFSYVAIVSCAGCAVPPS